MRLRRPDPVRHDHPGRPGLAAPRRAGTLNKAIEKSTGTQEAAEFVDLYTPSQGHSVCDDAKWVEGFVTLPDQLSFVHPNALGHRNAADHVEEVMLNAIS